jgi:hypothetical protein
MPPQASKAVLLLSLLAPVAGAAEDILRLAPVTALLTALAPPAL